MIRLIKVVLPAPFGPIRRGARQAKAEAISLATTNAPKRLCRPTVSSDGVIVAPPGSNKPRMPPCANITSSTNSRPIQKYQNSGSIFAKWSCAIIYTVAPTKAPYSRPTPPNTSMMTISPER